MFGRFVKLFQDPRSGETDINLLLLGETGVGKSTFINSLSNYFNYPNFKKAQKAKIEVLIPTTVNISNTKKIYGQPDQNELHKNGAACTQQVKLYLFPIDFEGKKINLRLVDTPGVGDPRGMDQDLINVDNVLAYLATLKKLHGICFLLRSNQSRYTKFIEYCLKQILTRLDKTASDNIIFITTYSKCAQYTAGETLYHCLEPLVDDIKSKPPHVVIPLEKKNIFSVDNEALKALLEMQEGKPFSKYELEGLSKSWDISSRECRRLLTYIVGDSKNPPLRPHEVENTVSVNEVWFLIEQLAIPIAEVSDVLQDNIRVLERHKKNLNLETQSLSQLKQQLYIPCVDLEVKELDQPVTVCADAKCADIVKVNDVTKWHYRQRCHNPCYLKGIPKEMIGDPGLTSCAAMNGSETCNQCGCSWKVHMHIYKTTEKVEIQQEDNNVKDAIKTKEDAQIQIKNLMKTMERRQKELESESEAISESIAKFSYFLQEHALTPFNDAYADYIQHLIKNEKSLGKYSDAAVIEKLQKLLTRHQHLQKTFQKSAQRFESMYGEFDLTPEGIKKSINELYNLKHMGKKIEELIQKSSACRLKETQKNFDCVVSQQINLKGKTKKENKGRKFSDGQESVNRDEVRNSDEELGVNMNYKLHRKATEASDDTVSRKSQHSKLSTSSSKTNLKSDNDDIYKKTQKLKKASGQNKNIKSSKGKSLTISRVNEHNQSENESKQNRNDRMVCDSSEDEKQTDQTQSDDSDFETDSYSKYQKEKYQNGNAEETSEDEEEKTHDSSSDHSSEKSDSSSHQMKSKESGDPKMKDKFNEDEFNDEQKNKSKIEKNVAKYSPKREESDLGNDFEHLDRDE